MELNEQDVVNLVSQNKIKNKRTVFIPKKNDIKTNFTQINFSNGTLGDILHSNKVLINVNFENKKITINQKKKDDWVLFRNVNFDNWEIIFTGIKDLNIINKNEQRFNSFGLTGCLNFYNSSFKNTSIKALNGMCEDTINIVGSSGDIKEIQINNAYSDALDIDFSNINLNKIIIDQAGNDCTDFSGGISKISKLNLNNCLDKGISIGEASNITIEDITIKNSNTGIAVKDSSISKIKYANLENLNICLLAFNKKQEFYGGFLNILNNNCKNSLKDKEIDINSEILIKNHIFIEKKLN